MYINDLYNVESNLTDNNVEFKFGFDGTNYGYYKSGSSTITPFKNPVGTKSITANGTYDVTDYASANVNVGSTYKQGSFSTSTSSSVNCGWRPTSVIVVGYGSSYDAVWYGYYLSGIGSAVKVRSQFTGGSYGSLSLTNTGFSVTTPGSDWGTFTFYYLAVY